jgi:hypothetical protein
MKVVLDQTPPPADGAVSATATPATPRVPAPPAATPATTAAPQESNQNAANHPLPAGTLQTNVTFRRDDQGQIYYVLTDAQTGKEIREVPPEEIRKVGENIEEFVKQLNAKSTTHVETQA